jgi:hypothetical protein
MFGLPCPVVHIIKICSGSMNICACPLFKITSVMFFLCGGDPPLLGGLFWPELVEVLCRKQTRTKSVITKLTSINSSN